MVGHATNKDNLTFFFKIYIFFFISLSNYRSLNNQTSYLLYVLIFVRYSNNLLEIKTMRDALNFLGLSEDEIDIYLHCVDKLPLTIGEIRSFKSTLSEADLLRTLESLVRKKLFKKITFKTPESLVYYATVPPLSAIETNIAKVSNDLSETEGNIKAKLHDIIDQVIEKENKIELDTVYMDFKKLLDSVEKDAVSIKQEVKELVEPEGKKSDFEGLLENREKEIQNMINSQIAGIVVLVLQLKNEIRDKAISFGINDQQWNAIKDDIKNALAQGTHEKAQELNDIISEEFRDLKNALKETVSQKFKSQIEQNSIYLGILNMFRTELIKLNKVILLKKNNIESDLKTLNKSISSKSLEALQKINSKFVEQLKKAENFSQQIQKTLFEQKENLPPDFWIITNQARLREELTTLITNSKEELIIGVPKLQVFFQLNEINKATKGLKIKLVASDSHKSDLVKELVKKENIDYKRLKNNATIFFKSDNSYIGLGGYQKQEDEAVPEVTGFSSKSTKLISLITPLIIEKWNEAKYSREVRITNGFNEVLKNINDYKGKKIGKMLQNILDSCFKKSTLSLNVVEMKLLISKLKAVNELLSADMKKIVTDKIKILNKEASRKEIIAVPEVASTVQKEKVPIKEIPTPKEPPHGEIKLEEMDREKLINLFELFVEKLDVLKGKELAEQVQMIGDLVLKLQGQSAIVSWKNTFTTLDKPLELTMKTQVKDDFNRWKEYILKLTEPPKALVQPEGLPQSGAIGAEPAPFEDEYLSPALSLKQAGSKQISAKPSENISSLLNAISEKVDVLTGLDISKKIQNVVDIMIETKGHAIDLKNIKNWISKLRMIRNPMETELKNQFVTDFNAWKENVLSGSPQAQSMEASPASIEILEKNTRETTQDKERIVLQKKFDSLLEKTKTLKGSELYNDLQEIADVILPIHGALAVKEMRQWTSKLRSIREPLKDEMKSKFTDELKNWKSKFC